MNNRVKISANLVFLIAIFFSVTSTLEAATSFFYVDPDWTGSQTGAPETPWTSLSSGPWSTINSALASGPVTVYFSARNAGSDTSETSGAALNLDRTNTSNNVLTLDGMSKYNTNDGSPVWAAYSGTSRFKITTHYPCSSNNYSSQVVRNYVTVRGFKFEETLGGQVAYLSYLSNVIFEFNDLTHIGSPDNGPGVVLVGNHIIFRNNVVHHVQGEGVYVGGWYEEGTTRSGTVYGDDLLIENNTVYDVGFNSGEADGIDVKDGWTNLIIRGNIVYQSALSRGRCAIIVESAAVIERNLVYNYGTGIALDTYYNTSVGRNGTVIRNNILVDLGGHSDDLDGAIALAGAHALSYRFTNTKIYNNTIWKNVDAGIFIRDFDGPGIADNVTIRNNIIDNTGDLSIKSSASGKIVLHTNNLYRRTSGGTLVQDGASSYSSTDLAAYEATAMSADPKFTTTSTPYVGANFKLQATSLCISAGTTITTFSDDFAGIIRSIPWTSGAFQSSGAALQPPTGLRVLP